MAKAKSESTAKPPVGGILTHTKAGTRVKIQKVGDLIVRYAELKGNSNRIVRERVQTLAKFQRSYK